MPIKVGITSRVLQYLHFACTLDEYSP